MELPHLNWIANFIWGIADDVLRDIYVRGKYRDVILPMTVLRRMDAVLEPTKKEVLRIKAEMDEQGITNQDMLLRQTAGEAFYNTSSFTMKDLRARATQSTLKADFEAYLDGFSPNVQIILDNFEFRNQIPRLVKADILGLLIEKFLDPGINLSPNPMLNGDGSIKQPGLDNHAMGTIFEELVRRFNEENNEEAGEHWTPRDVVRLMAEMIFLPIIDDLPSSSYLIYDGACGTGGMLTMAQEAIQEFARDRGKDVKIHLFGQEINPETYAICKADMLLSGDGEEADNIVGGSDHSTLSNDAFPILNFDFMLSNPPYGKSWKSDQDRMGGKDGIKDPRFLVEYKEDPEFSLVTRSSDGQLLFLANMVSKMKQDTLLGSRIAEVHNGSSLFTGDAGQGESNIRRYIIENNWLEAIIALPLNMFYNTGIATYIWILSNRKSENRKGKVQLIDATSWFSPLRKNLGKKNCELTDEDRQRIYETYTRFEENEHSKIFPNEAFGYWKVTVERPLRLRVNLDDTSREAFRRTCKASNEDAFADFIDSLSDVVGTDPSDDFYAFQSIMEAQAEKNKFKLTSKQVRLLKNNLAVRDETAKPVIQKILKSGKADADPLRGCYETNLNGKRVLVEYEPDPKFRDTEQIPLLEEGGIDTFIRREVLPYAPDAWYVPDSIKIGYEISFTRYFYKPQPMRTLDEIRTDILNLEKETDGLLDEILDGGE